MSAFKCDYSLSFKCGAQATTDKDSPGWLFTPLERGLVFFKTSVPHCSTREKSSDFPVWILWVQGQWHAFSWACRVQMQVSQVCGAGLHQPAGLWALFQENQQLGAEPMGAVQLQLTACGPGFGRWHWGWQAKVIPAASLGESEWEPGKAGSLTGTRNLRGASSARRSCPDHTARVCGVTGSGLQETSFSGFTSPWQFVCRRCLGPPSPPHPSVPASSTTTACAFGLACIFHMCCPGQFPPSVKFFSSNHKSMAGTNTQNKTHTVQVHEFVLDGSEGKESWFKFGKQWIH